MRSSSVRKYWQTETDRKTNVSSSTKTGWTVTSSSFVNHFSTAQPLLLLLHWGREHCLSIGRTSSQNVSEWTWTSSSIKIRFDALYSLGLIAPHKREIQRDVSFHAIFTNCELPDLLEDDARAKGTSIDPARLSKLAQYTQFAVLGPPCNSNLKGGLVDQAHHFVRCLLYSLPPDRLPKW